MHDDDIGAQLMLAVSTGVVDITPPIGYPMGGYGRDAPRLSTGVNEPLCARCTILWADDVPKVIVTADVLALGRTMHQLIRNRVITLGVQTGDFVLTVTHTHNGPVLTEKLHPYIAYNIQDLTEVEQYCLTLVETIVLLVTSTLSAPRTVCTLDYSIADENFSYNREGLPYDEVDVPILVARNLSGAPRAVVFGYGAHTVAANGQTEFDPDYPAQAIKEIEATGEDVFAQFMLGPAGDQNPREIGDFSSSDWWGADLGATVANAIESEGRPLWGPIDTAYSEVSLPLDVDASLSAILAMRAAYLTRSMREDILGFQRRHAEIMLAQIDFDTFSTDLIVPVQTWTIHGSPSLHIVFCAGEVVSGYAVALRLAHGGSDAVWFNAYSNEVPAYIPSDELLGRPGYAAGADMDAPRLAGGSMSVYGLIGHFLRGDPSIDGVEQILLAHIKGML